MSEEGEALIEGDEEVQYVMVVLPSQEAALATAGMELVLEGLDTHTPSLRDRRGSVVLQGVYEDTLGSLLVMADKDKASSSGPDHGGSLQYLCHTTKQLRMFHPPAPQQARTEAQPKAGAAGGEGGTAPAAAAGTPPPDASLAAGDTAGQ